jgi:hypothetical protein
MRSFFSANVGLYARNSIFLVLSVVLAGCAAVSLTPSAIQPPKPALVSDAIEAEPTVPVQIAVRDFTFSPSSVKENAAPLHRATDLFRSSSVEERRIEIGNDTAAKLSEQAADRLGKIDLPAIRIAADSDAPLYDNTLLVTGRLIDVDEGNRFTRIALGLGAGESRLATEVHVFRVMHGQRAEVLAFSTYADSGRMPGVILSIGAGEFLLGPITAITVVEDVASSGQKIYSSQMEYLAGKTAGQVANYLSQYSADEGWIPQSKAKSVKLAAG